VQLGYARIASVTDVRNNGRIVMSATTKFAHKPNSVAIIPLKPLRSLSPAQRGKLRGHVFVAKRIRATGAGTGDVRAFFSRTPLPAWATKAGTKFESHHGTTTNGADCGTWVVLTDAVSLAMTLRVNSAVIPTDATGKPPTGSSAPRKANGATGKPAKPAKIATESIATEPADTRTVKIVSNDLGQPAG
jgi:hypothetical protein